MDIRFRILQADSGAVQYLGFAKTRVRQMIELEGEMIKHSGVTKTWTIGDATVKVRISYNGGWEAYLRLAAGSSARRQDVYPITLEYFEETGAISSSPREVTYDNKSWNVTAMVLDPAEGGSPVVTAGSAVALCGSVAVTIEQLIAGQGEANTAHLSTEAAVRTAAQYADTVFIQEMRNTSGSLGQALLMKVGIADGRYAEYAPYKSTFSSLDVSADGEVWAIYQLELPATVSDIPVVTGTWATDSSYPETQRGASRFPLFAKRRITGTSTDVLSTSSVSIPPSAIPYDFNVWGMAFTGSLSIPDTAFDAEGGYVTKIVDTGSFSLEIVVSGTIVYSETEGGYLFTGAAILVNAAPSSQQLYDSGIAIQLIMEDGTPKYPWGRQYVVIDAATAIVPDPPNAVAAWDVPNPGSGYTYDATSYEGDWSEPSTIDGVSGACSRTYSGSNKSIHTYIASRAFGGPFAYCYTYHEDWSGGQLLSSPYIFPAGESRLREIAHSYAAAIRADGVANVVTSLDTHSTNSGSYFVEYLVNNGVGSGSFTYSDINFSHKAYVGLTPVVMGSTAFTLNESGTNIVQSLTLDSRYGPFSGWTYYMLTGSYSGMYPGTYTTHAQTRAATGAVTITTVVEGAPYSSSINRFAVDSTLIAEVHPLAVPYVAASGVSGHPHTMLLSDSRSASGNFHTYSSSITQDYGSADFIPCGPQPDAYPRTGSEVFGPSGSRVNLILAYAPNVTDSAHGLCVLMANLYTDPVVVAVYAAAPVTALEGAINQVLDTYSETGPEDFADFPGVIDALTEAKNYYDSNVDLEEPPPDWKDTFRAMVAAVVPLTYVVKYNDFAPQNLIDFAAAAGGSFALYRYHLIP